MSYKSVVCESQIIYAVYFPPKGLSLRTQFYHVLHFMIGHQMLGSLMGLNVIHRNFQLLLLKLTLEDIRKSNFMTHSKCRVAE